MDEDVEYAEAYNPSIYARAYSWVRDTVGCWLVRLGLWVMTDTQRNEILRLLGLAARKGLLP